MLFQIGSNTKAFTAVTLLQLEADGKLRMDDRIGRWFPQYPAWRNITIRQLLNMTSGIPTYDAVPAMWKPYVADPYRFYSTADLIAYVYPKRQFAPSHGWLYSNTAYLLSEMIIEAVTKHDYAVELRHRFFDGGRGSPTSTITRASTRPRCRRGWSPAISTAAIPIMRRWLRCSDATCAR